MTEQEKLEIQKGIYNAFKDVKLQNGIGYWEAAPLSFYFNKYPNRIDP